MMYFSALNEKLACYKECESFGGGLNFTGSCYKRGLSNSDVTADDFGKKLVWEGGLDALHFFFGLLKKDIRTFNFRSNGTPDRSF